MDENSERANIPRRQSMKQRHTETEMKPRFGEHDQREAIERVYRGWDKVLAEGEVEGLLGFYAKDGVLESPLVPHLLETKHKKNKEHHELRRLFEVLSQRNP